MNKIFLLISLYFGVAHFGYAQVQSSVDEGLGFANTIAPTSPSQLVNPAGVNSGTWNLYGNTNTPTAPPSNMGVFSNPNTSDATYNSASSMGLSGIGNQEKFDCANYTPGVDPNRDQQCAAVNYMNNNCLPTNQTQQGVIANTATSTAGTGNCQGTYGQGASQFGYLNMTETDAVFTNVKNAQSTAPSVFDNSACSPVTSTTPAEYSTSTCTKSLTTVRNTCSQSLFATINTNYGGAVETQSCPGGVLVGNYCQANTSGTPETVYACPAGYTLNGTSCVGATTINAIVASYSCPPGQNFVGSSCQSTIPPTTGAPGSCPAGYTLENTPGGPICRKLTTACPGSAYVVEPSNPSAPPNQVCTSPCPAGTHLPGQNIHPSVTLNWVCTTTRFGTSCGWQGNGFISVCIPDDFVNCPANTRPVQANWSLSRGAGVMTVCGPTPYYEYACTPGYTQAGPSTCLPPSTTATVGDPCPASGMLNGVACTTSSTTSATVSYSCSSPTSCTRTITAITPVTPNYSCPVGLPGTTLSGGNCLTVTTEPVSRNYSCADGSAPVNGLCVFKDTQQSWTDSCITYETSAGSLLPTP